MSEITNPYQVPASSTDLNTKKTSVPLVIGLVLAIVIIGYPGVKWAFKEYKLRQTRHLPDVENYLTVAE